MPKSRTEQSEAFSLTARRDEEAATGKPQPEKLFTPEKREANPAILTAEQYLKTANLDEGVGGLVRSMYGTRIMFFAEWEAAVKTLLKRQVR